MSAAQPLSVARALYFPCAFALAMPSRCRSSIISRSNWAIAANLACLSYETLARVTIGEKARPRQPTCNGVLTI
jgi:hypothetical protein